MTTATTRPHTSSVRPSTPSPRRSAGSPSRPGGGGAKAEHEILFQQYFKSVGPRTYAAQVKRASNGNHYLILTEGNRDGKSGELRKTRLFLFSEDFAEFFKMVKSTAEFIKANPVPPEVKGRRERFWAKQAGDARSPAPMPPASA